MASSRARKTGQHRAMPDPGAQPSIPPKAPGFPAPPPGFTTKPPDTVSSRLLIGSVTCSEQPNARPAGPSSMWRAPSPRSFPGNDLGRVGWKASIPEPPVDHIAQRLAALEARDLVEHIGDERARIGGGRVVRRDRDLGVRPQWAVARQRLVWKHIEGRARERALVERGEDVGVDLQPAASRIDQIGAAERAVVLELAKQRKGEDSIGRRRVRQQAD